MTENLRRVAAWFISRLSGGSRRSPQPASPPLDEFY